MKERKRFKDLIDSAAKAIAGMPAMRTSNCPPEADLLSLCLEDELSERERERLLVHVVTCSYCIRVIKEFLRMSHSEERAREINKHLFPLTNEVDWERVKAIELFKDDRGVASRGFAIGAAATFEINEPGFYYLAIGTRQVVWRRAISREEFVLSEEELERAMSLGMAADTGRSDAAIVGFEEALWEGTLQISLVKGETSGNLTVLLVPKQ